MLEDPTAARDVIRLPPPPVAWVREWENTPCFLPHPLHCCCEGERGLLGSTVGGLVRVAVIDGCEIGGLLSFLSLTHSRSSFQVLQGKAGS